MIIAANPELDQPLPLTAAGELRRSWRPLIAAILGLGFSGGASLYWFGVLIAPLAKEFGWSNSALSGWALLIHLTTYLLGPLSGILIDRIGARVVALWSIPLVAFGFFTVGLTMNALWMLYLGAIIVGASNSCLMAFTRTINTWFNAGRGLALGLAYSGAGITSIVGPRICLYVVDSFGWRTGFVFMGALTLLPLPAIFFWLRERRHSTGPKPAPTESGYKMTEVLRMPAFWFIGVGGVLYFLAFHGVQFSLIPFLTEGGSTRTNAADLAGVMGFFILVGKLAVAPLYDRLRAPFVLASLFAADVGAILLLAAFHGAGAVVGLAIIGLAQGGMMSGMAFSVARYFGVKFFAGIFGMISMLLSLSSLGSLLFGGLRDSSASYQLPLYVSSGLMLGAAGLFFCLGFRPYFDDGAPKTNSGKRPG